MIKLTELEKQKIIEIKEKKLERLQKTLEGAARG